MIEQIVIQYSTSTAWQSEVIRRLCHSSFSHVDFVITPGMAEVLSTPDDPITAGLLGASGRDPKLKDPGGVCVRSFSPWPYRDTPRLVHIHTDKAEAIIRRGLTQRGKPFDTEALWTFLTTRPGDRDWRNDKKWFCSEFIVWCCELEGLFPYSLATLKDRISPADSLLIFNPFMTEENIEQFTGIINEQHRLAAEK